MTDEEKIAQMWAAEAAAKKDGSKKAAKAKKAAKPSKKPTEHGVGTGRMVAGSPLGGATSSAIAPPPKVRASKDKVPGMKRIERTVSMSSMFDGVGLTSGRDKTNLDSIVSRKAKKAMAGSQKPFPDQTERESVCKDCFQIFPATAMTRTSTGPVCRDCG